MIGERNPILFIYVIKVKKYEGEIYKELKEKLPKSKLIYAIGIGFPDVGLTEQNDFLVNSGVNNEES